MSFYRVIFYDEDIIVISKKEGLLSIKGRGDLRNVDSLYDMILKEFGKVYLVHRIDKDTSGIIVFARNKKIHRELNMLFENKSVKKTYLAVVWGNIRERVEINAPIKEFGSGRCGVSVDGKPSLTLVLPKCNLRKFSLVEVIPYTGRRHQIRVHLYSINHPIVGDRLYGDLDLQKQFKRMYLHSSKISFEINGKKYSFDDSQVFLDIVNETFL